jgi:putative nucleotidyltransferase with HDIG domain
VHRAGHHAYLGGLLEHTVAVPTLALETCTLHPRLDQNLLLTAAIVHDLGKTREFTLGAEIGLTDEGRLLGHVELGLRMIDERSAPLDEPRRLALAHCVLTHHGDRRPATPEALALQRLNAIDAAVKGAWSTGCRRALNEEAPVLGAPAPRRWAAEPGGLGTAGRSPVQSPPRRKSSYEPRAGPLAAFDARRSACARRRSATAGRLPLGHDLGPSSGRGGEGVLDRRSNVARVNGFWTKARLRARAPLRTSTSSVCPDM